MDGAAEMAIEVTPDSVGTPPVDVAPSYVAPDTIMVAPR